MKNQYASHGVPENCIEMQRVEAGVKAKVRSDGVCVEVTQDPLSHDLGQARVMDQAA
ncbi:MAG: hypothetical protein RL618_1250, partial [Pseudomonadota bacterium]